MRLRVSFSLAFGLVAASPCKPLTSGSTAASTTFSSAIDIFSTPIESATSTVKTLATETSTVIESETSAAIDTTASEDSTLVGFTSTEIKDATISASETSSQATSDTTLLTLVTPTDITTDTTTETSAVETSSIATFADTTTTGTIETSAVDISAATTTTVETTTVMATTTTSEEAGPTDYPLIAGQGAAQGLPLKSTNQAASFMIFGERTSSWTPGRFFVDPTSAYLTQNGVPVCAKYRFMDRSAALVLCPTEYNQYGTARLTCTRNPAPGTALQCSAVKLDCVANGPGDSQRCTVGSEANWTKFFIAASSDYTWYLGADDLVSPYYTSLDVFVDRAPTVVTPTAT